MSAQKKKGTSRKKFSQASLSAWSKLEDDFLTPSDHDRSCSFIFHQSEQWEGRGGDSKKEMEQRQQRGWCVYRERGKGPEFSTSSKTLTLLHIYRVLRVHSALVCFSGFHSNCMDTKGAEDEVPAAGAATGMCTQVYMDTATLSAKWHSNTASQSWINSKVFLFSKTGSL